MRQLLLSVALVCAGSGAMAVTAGQPFLVAEDDTSGSILDFFGPFGPSGQQDVTVSGTITESFGWNGVVGDAFRFSSSSTGSATLTLGSDDLAGASLFDSGTGAYFYDPFGSVAGPGDLNFRFFVLPTIVGDVDQGDGTSEFSYGGEFVDFGPRVAVFPEFEMLLSVYLDAPLPMRIFEEFDDDGALLFSTPYIDGPLVVDRIEFGLIGGDPIGAVPLPAGLPLLAGGLAMLALSRRRRR